MHACSMGLLRQRYGAEHLESRSLRTNCSGPCSGQPACLHQRAWCSAACPASNHRDMGARPGLRGLNIFDGTGVDGRGWLRPQPSLIATPLVVIRTTHSYEIWKWVFLLYFVKTENKSMVCQDPTCTGNPKLPQKDSDKYRYTYSLLGRTIPINLSSVAQKKHINRASGKIGEWHKIASGKKINSIDYLHSRQISCKNRTVRNTSLWPFISVNSTENG